MKVRDLSQMAGLTPVVLADPELEVEGCYAGDLLSWEMGNASHGCAWVTIMTNRNIIAVASLIEMACIILAEGCEPAEELVQLAQEQGINLLCSAEPIYETCVRLSRAL